MLIQSIQSIDRTAVQWIARHRRPLLTTAFRWFTYSGTGRVWFTLAAVLNVLHWQGIAFVVRQGDFMNALLCPLVAWAVSFVLKRIVKRARPPQVIAGFVPAAPPPSCGSFPSSHAASSLAFFAGLLCLSHPLAPVVGVWAALVSFSRFYLGVHFLTDIIGGALLGALSIVILVI